VGTAGVGKSSLVELLAELSGNQLHVLPMNSATDTTELLGGFEQVYIYIYIYIYIFVTDNSSLLETVISAAYSCNVFRCLNALTSYS
jgi:midasin (ATPase involved in ribosome maturation)